MDFDLTPAAELFSKSKVALSDPILVGAASVAVKDVITKIEPMLTEERIQKTKNVVAHRWPGVITVLENIYDRGNVSAVMRSAEALGFFRFLMIEEARSRFKASNRVTKGAEKWLDVQVTASTSEAMEPLKAQGFQIVGTDLNATHSFADIAFDRPTALVIGNEKEGITEEMKAYVDVRVKLPMVGFSQSFNLSVAAGMIFQQSFQALARQPKAKPTTEQFHQIYANYLLRCVDNPERLFRKD